VHLLLDDWVVAERDRIVATLLEWLRIPSISAQPVHAGDVHLCADFTAGLLAGAGLENVEVLETGNGGLPSVYADHLGAGPGAPTVLVYGHHDVQPVDPLDEWTSPPFEPVLADGEIRGRGAVDDKGQVLFQIEAVRGLLARGGPLPVNVKFLVEGEEEVGSPNFEALLEAERGRLACDVTGIAVGYAGPGVKTIVPAQGRFTATFRLVPDQRPDVVTRAFEEWLQGRVLDAPVLYLGVALPDDRFHAPNERMVMDQFWRGVLAAGELLDELGRSGV